jgi:L-ascorbate metabolism protein UlaG (beta-lactamase superfamily)
MDPLLSGRPADGISPSPVPVEKMYDADIVMITHGAGDHVGQAFDILENSKAILVCDVATRHLALEAGISPERIYYMLSGVEYTLKDITVKALPAKHISLVKLKSGFVNGQPLSYIIGTPAGEKIFFGGDTSIHGDFKLYGELYRPQFAILGVGGVDIHGQSLIELHPDEAALAAKWLGVRMAVPIHYRFDEGERFVAALKKTAPDIEGLLMKPGDRYTFKP